MGKSTRRMVLVFSLLAVLATGCGSGFTPFGGRVCFSDGTPLPKGQVRFVSQTHMATGVIQPDGSFQLGSLDVGDGLPPGEYRITIVGAVEETIDPATTYVISSKPLIDKRYEENETSGLTCVVTESKRDYQITVEPPKK